MTPAEHAKAVDPCRCGFAGHGEHPCHGKAYACRRPASRRFVTYPTALAGMQPKLGAYETWACDECWAAWRNMKRENEKGTES